MRVVLWAPPINRPVVEPALAAVEGVDLVSVDNAPALIRALPDAEVLVLPVFSYSPEVAQAVRDTAKKLRLIQLLTVGYDRLEKERLPDGVVVATAGDSLAHGVAEHAMALLLALGRRFPEAWPNQARAQWAEGYRTRMTVLDGQTLAVVGFGAIGRQIGIRARAFGATVIGLRRHPQDDPAADEVRPIEDLDQVLGRADAIAISAPMTAQTKGMFDAARFARCKPGALLVNIARGPIVNTNAMIDALKSGQLGGAGLDVTDPEPLPHDHPLWQAPNLIITPHVAAAGGYRRLGNFVRDNVMRLQRSEELRATVTIG